MGRSDRRTPDEGNFDAWAEWCGGGRLGDGGCGGSGGEEGGGDQCADEGDGAEDGVGAVEAVDERVTRGCAELVGGACEPGVLEVLGSDEGAADRAVGGVDGLRGEVAGDFLVETARVQRGGDASRHRDAKGSAEESGGVVDSGSDAGLGGGDGTHDRLRGGRGDEAEPTTAQNHLSGDGEVGGACVVGGDPQQSDAPQAKASGHDRLVAGSDREPGAHQGGDGDGGGHGQEADAGAEGRVALDELEVLGDEEREPGEGQERDGNGAAGSGETRVPKQPDVEHRARHAALDVDEHGQDAKAGGDGGEGAGGTPPPMRGLNDAEDERAHAQARERQAAPVQGRGGGIPRCRHGHGDERGDEGGDGHHDEEDAAPPELFEEPAADDGAGGDADPGGGTPQADGLGTLLALGEDIRDQRERGGKDGGGTDAHDHSGRDQLLGGGSERSGKAAGAEDAQAE